MGQFIQVGPFEQKPRTSFLMGQAFGNAAQKVSDMYLQSKVQDMLENKKRGIELEKQKASGRSLYNIASQQGIEGSPEDFENLPMNVQASMSKSMFRDLGNQDYSNKFAGATDLQRQTNNNGQAPIQTTNVVPGVAPEQQAQANQQRAYQTEAQMLNQPNQQNQQQQISATNGGMPTEEPLSTEEQINQGREGALNEANKIRTEEMAKAKNPRQKSAIMKDYNSVVKDINTEAENQRKGTESKIEGDKAVDKKTRDDVEETMVKGQAAEKNVQILQEMASIRSRGNLGKVPSLLSGAKALLGGGGMLGAAAAYPEIDADKKAYAALAMILIQPYVEAQGRGITNTEFPRYAALVPSPDDFDTTNERKEQAMFSLIQQDLKKRDIYRSIEKPDGTYPRNAAAMVDKLLSESTKEVDKIAKDAVKPLTSLKQASVGTQFNQLPKGATVGDKIGDENGNVLVWDGKSWKKAK